jgi:hypothetical protein
MNEGNIFSISWEYVKLWFNTGKEFLVKLREWILDKIINL